MRFLLATCRSKPALTPGDALLAEALRRLGATVSAAPWNDIDPLRDAGVVCLRSTWDYHLRYREFTRWVAGFEGDARLWNPPGTVGWNADKVYLCDLAAAGVSLPRTRWFAPGERPDVAAVLEAWGVPRAVLKPRVSATAYGTHVVDRKAALGPAEWEPLERSGCLLQEFVPEIQSRGEVSLVFLGGDFSHAMLKRPGGGDFRVQAEFGGSLRGADPAAETVAFGERVLAAAARPWIYARVDFVETKDGPVLMELELIEPDLFLTAGSAARLAAELVGAAGRSGA